MSFMVKGARRKESPFRVALDPLALAEVVYLPSPRRDLQIPREAHLLRYHSQLRSQLEYLAMAQVMAEVVLRLSQSGGHYREEYELLIEALAWLDGDEVSSQSVFAGIAKEFALAQWLCKLTDSLGFGFRMDTCVECQTPLRGKPADLWPALGGGVCASCLGSRRPSWNADFLQQIFSFVQLRQTEGSPSRIEHFLIQFLRIHVGHSLDIRSMEWLDNLRGVHPQGDSHVDSF